MSCCLKKYAKKTVVLTPQRPQGAITPLTSELAKLEYLIRNLIDTKKYITMETLPQKNKNNPIFSACFFKQTHNSTFACREVKGSQREVKGQMSYVLQQKAIVS